MLPILFGVLAGLQVNPLQATQDAWPALFDVIDVVADYVLNLRNRLSLDAVFEQVLSGCCTLAP